VYIMTKYIKYISLIIVIPNFAFGQLDTINLREFEPFLKDQVSEYTYWLNQCGFSSISTVQDLEVLAEKVVVTLKSNYSTDDSLKAFWKHSQHEYYQQTKQLLSEKLLSQFTFLSDLLPHQVEIII